MLSRIVVPIYVVLVLISSLALNLSPSPWMLLLTGALFFAAYILEFRHPAILPVRMLLLGLLHWSTHLNWMQPLYLLLVGRDCYPVKSVKPLLGLWLVYSGMYSAIRLSYSDINAYSLLVTLYDAFAFALAIYLSKYLFQTEQNKESLDTQNRLLTKTDALTGLYNFEEYHRQVDKLIHNKTPLVLILLDCTNLKSLNTMQGFAGGDRILKEIAEMLKTAFSDAYMIARYGGDEFALAIEGRSPDTRVSNIKQMLESEITKLTGVQITYGYAVYPTDGTDKEALIHAAEKMLFDMKSEIWIKRENHLVQSEKLRVVGELASGMAHEIRNPLTTVKGFLQISKSNGYNIEPWYELIMDEINRMSELTAEFLQFSKPHVVLYKVRPLHQCLHRVISLMESESVRLGHRISYQPINPELEVHMDQDKLVQLFLNLIKNSFEAMPEEGDVTIRLFTSESYAVVEIQDTGKGIPESEMDKVFHPFYTTKENGTGLGLSICHKIVVDHGGIMEMESKLQVGTTFRIMLPQAKVPEEAAV